MSGKICCSQNELHKLTMTSFNLSNFVYQVIYMYILAVSNSFFVPNFTCSVSFFGQYNNLPIHHRNNDLNLRLLTLVATETVIKC